MVPAALGVRLGPWLEVVRPAGAARRAVAVAGAAVLAAWAAVAWLGAGGGHAAAAPGAGPMHHGGMAMAGEEAGHAMSLTGGGMAMWVAMVAAMMGPGALPAVRHVAENSLSWRRGRATATFLLVYAASWTVAGLVVLVVASWLRPRSAVALAGALAVAALWQLTVHKRRGVRDCHRTVPLPPRGVRALAGATRFGRVYAWACIRSCWALMLVMALVTTATLPWMLGLSAVTTAEKLVARPRRLTRTVAGLLGVTALWALTIAVR